MTIFNTQIDMLKLVAHALGPELRQQMTFVGGCTTGLLLTDAFTREQVRSTDDVDLIVHVMGYQAFATLQHQLGQRGFKVSVGQDDDDFPICAMKLGDLRVDFIPDERVLGFSNRWYKDAVATATPCVLDDEITLTSSPPSPWWALLLREGRTGIPTALGCFSGFVASVGSCC